MPTSGSYDFNLNRDQVIKGALRKLGVIGEGQTPTATQISDAAESLNILVKAWEADGLPLWCIKTVSFPLVAGTNIYSIGPGQTINTQEPLKVYQGWYRDTTSNVDVPLVQLAQQQYNTLSAKSQTGAVTQFYYERLNGVGNVYTYLTPDATFAATKQIYLLFQRPFQDFDGSTDLPDFPQEWLRALVWGLAAELAFDNGYPTKDREELFIMAEKFKDEALGFTQEESSLWLQPDTRTWTR